MASFLDNLELGAAGVVDLALGTSYAAEVFAEQVAEDAAANTSSTTLQNLPAAEREAAAREAGRKATADGALETAAKNTGAELADKAQALAGYLKPALIVGGVAVGLIAVAYVWRSFK